MRHALAIAFALLCLGSTAAAQTVLYDASAGQKVSQFGGWIVNPLSLESFSGGATLYSTTAAGNAAQGGFSRFAPALDRSTGFDLHFTIKVDGETHDGANGPNRSGVSLIVITSDLQGIELAFWTDRVWAQSGPSFTKAEEGFIDTTAALTDYRLRIVGNAYQLSVAGSTIVSGPLRSYASFGAPYTIANFMFFGDDTTSARGSFRTSRIVLGPVTDVFGDLDGNGFVDSADLGLLLLNYGPCEDGCGGADLDGSGEVDSADLGLLLLSFD